MRMLETFKWWEFGAMKKLINISISSVHHFCVKPSCTVWNSECCAVGYREPLFLLALSSLPFTPCAGKAFIWLLNDGTHFRYLSPKEKSFNTFSDYTSSGFYKKRTLFCILHFTLSLKIKEPQMRVVTQILSNSGFYNALENAISSVTTQLIVTHASLLEFPHSESGQCQWCVPLRWPACGRNSSIIFPFTVVFLWMMPLPCIGAPSDTY